MPDASRSLESPASTVQSDRAFLGHPRGLAYLAFSEGWERFSYYGMTALLALYSAQYLFKPEHIGNIWGFAAFRRLLEALLGPPSASGLSGPSSASSSRRKAAKPQMLPMCSGLKRYCAL